MEAQNSRIDWQEWWIRNEHLIVGSEKRNVTRSGSAVSMDDLSPEMKSLVAFLMKQMKHDYWDVRAASAIALGKVGLVNDEIRGVLESAASSDGEKSVRESAVLALGMIGSAKSSFLLCRMLEDKDKVDHEIRAYCALAMGLMKDTSNLQALRKAAIDERKDEVRAAAVTALGLIGDEGSARVLVDIFTGQDEECIRALAATALGKIGVKEICLIPNRNNSKVDLRRQFERHLVNKETRDCVRQSIAMVLGRIGDDKTEAVLKGVVTSDRDDAVRAFAMLSLARIRRAGAGDGSGSAVLRGVLRTEKRTVLRCYAALAAGLSGDAESGRQLREIFESGEHQDVRAAAALALGMLKDETSMPLLGAEIAKPRGPGEARRFSCIALGLIGNPGAKSCLVEVLEKVADPYFKWSAAMGLAKLGDKSSIGLLLDKLSSGSTVVKEASIRAIGCFRDESTIAPLIERFGLESNREIQAMYVVALGCIGDSSGEIPVLRQVSQDFNWLAATKYASIDFVTRVF